MTESEIRYLIDEDTTHRIRKGLQRRQPSIDIKVVGEEGAPPLGTKDADILDYLEKAGDILISMNRSTMPKHLQAHLQKGGHVPGILILREGFSLGRIIETLELIWFAGTPEEFRDRIIYIPF